MNRRTLLSERFEFVHGFASDKKNGLPDKMRGELCRYLFILAHNFLEVALKEVLQDSIESRCDPGIAGYIQNSLQRYPNLNYHRSEELIEALNPGLTKKLPEKELIKIGDHINSLYALRNQAAHGHNVTTDLSRVKEYFDSVCEFVKMVEEGTRKHGRRGRGSRRPL